MPANDDWAEASTSDTNADDKFTCSKEARDLDVTVGIVTAYVSNNSLRPADLPVLIAEVHAAVAAPSITNAGSAAQVEMAKPAAIRKSITPDALISFIDGKPYKTLKRHLTAHGLDFDTYRARYGLPADYPVVCANYSAARSALAKDIGLGKSVVGRAMTKADLQDVLDRT